jgi:23S rRNA pseudouridine2457 synthase
MAKLVLLNKPFQVLSQFTDAEGRQTLAGLVSDPTLRVAGRLDYDSEGLLLLTDDGHLQQRIANPRFKTWKTYWVQVEGRVGEAALQSLRAGVVLNDGPTLPARATTIEQPASLWSRDPPIRERKQQATSWLELQIREGRNRQVRRMTANVGHPTLRLLRIAIGVWSLQGLEPGQWREQRVNMPRAAPVRQRKRRL